MPAKQTSPEVAALAGRVMAGYWPNRDEVLSLAASCLSQDEKPAELDGNAGIPADPEYPEPEGNA